MAYPKITKNRFKEFAEYVTDANGSIMDSNDLLAKFRNIFNFDPDMRVYSEDRVKKNKEYRDRKKLETGLSTYELFNKAKYYHENKDAITARRIAKKKALNEEKSGIQELSISAKPS